MVQNGRDAPNVQCHAQNQAVFRGSLDLSRLDVSEAVLTLAKGDPDGFLRDGDSRARGIGHPAKGERPDGLTASVGGFRLAALVPGMYEGKVSSFPTLVVGCRPDAASLVTVKLSSNLPLSRGLSTSSACTSTHRTAP